MAPRVVVIGLASDFGCQVQMTNMEDDLLDVLGLIELVVLAARLERAHARRVRRRDHRGRRHHRRARRAAEARARQGATVIVDRRVRGDRRHPRARRPRATSSRASACVYGDGGALVACGRIAPMPVDAVIDVDYHVPGCPIDPAEFVAVLQRALMGLSDKLPREPMCASCKMARERLLLLDRGEVCLGLVTRAGCGAKCVTLGRPCTGLPRRRRDANLDVGAARPRRARLARRASSAACCSSTTPSRRPADDAR